MPHIAIHYEQGLNRNIDWAFCLNRSAIRKNTRVPSNSNGRETQLSQRHMKLRALRSFPRFVLGVMITQQIFLLLVHGEDASQKELKPKSRFTAVELMASVPTPTPEDVASPKALVLALHDSISDPTGPFNWDRFRALFLPTAAIREAGSEPGGKPHIVFQPVQGWIQSVRDLRPKVSVYETVYKIHIEQFGSIFVISSRSTLSSALMRPISP